MPGVRAAPYAGRAYDPRAPRISDLLLRRGDVAAEGARRGGDIAGQTIANVGQIVSNGLGQVAQYQADRPRRELMDLQLQAARGEGEQQQQAADYARQVRALFEGEALPTPKDLLAVMGPDALPVIKGIAALKVENQAHYTSTQELLRDVARGIVALPPAMRPEAYAAARQNIVGRGIVAEDEAPAEYDEALVGRLAAYGQAPEKPETPKAPEPFTLGPGQQRFGPDGQPIASVAPTPEKPEREPSPTEASLALQAARGDKEAMAALRFIRAQRVTAGGAPSTDPGPLETIIGPDGKAIRVPRKDAVGKQPASSTSKPASGLEKRALNFFNRAQQADIDLEAMEGQVQAMGLPGQVRMAAAPNWAQSQLGQSYTAAQRAFTEARLRKDSGAAIPEQEFANDRRTYFAQPGDSPETLEQKRRGRAAMLASLAFESGQALSEFVGDPDESARIVASFKERAAKKEQSSARPKEGDTKPIEGYPGTEQTFRGGKWIRTK